MEEYLPISMVNTAAYCLRRFYLSYYLGEASENVHLIEGSFLHEAAYSEPDERSGVLVWSDRLGLVGVIDRLEVTDSGGTRVVEYKLGRAADEAFPSDAVQIAAQAVALAESRGTEASEAAVYYHKSHTRREVGLTDELFGELEMVLASMHGLLENPELPVVSVKPAKCKGCSLHEACQPELTRKRGKR